MEQSGCVGAAGLGEGLCTCSICILGGDLAAVEDGGGPAAGDIGLGFEQEPARPSVGRGCRLRASPPWPQINESCPWAGVSQPPLLGGGRDAAEQVRSQWL